MPSETARERIRSAIHLEKKSIRRSISNDSLKKVDLSRYEQLLEMRK